MFRKYPTYLFVLSFILLLTIPPACVSEVETPQPCFQSNILPIFVSKCSYSGCHDAIRKERGYDLTNYEGIMKGVKAGKPQSSEIYRQCASGEMPPRNYAQLSKLEIDLIKNWIRAGAQNTSNCNTCDTTYQYASRIKPVMESWCVACHSANTPSGGHDLSSWAGVDLSIQSGKFLGAIQHSAGFQAMPQGGSKLSDCDINAIVKWINAGHPNN